MLSSRFNLISTRSWRNHGHESYTSEQTSSKNFPTESCKVHIFRSSAKWKAHFDASKSTNKLMVIEFTASWCVPCRYMDPVMKEFAAKYTDVEFIKLDVDELMGVSSTFGVHTLPTQILIKKGNVVDKVTGVKKDELQRKIEKHRAYSYY